MVEDNRRDTSGKTTWSSTDTNTTYKTRLAHGGLGGPWWLALLLVPLLLALLVGGLGRGGVQDDLKARAAAALESQGISGVGLDFSGRDGKLTVPDGVDADQALKIVEGVKGVRVAEVEGGAAAPADDSSDDASGDDSGDPAADAATPYKVVVGDDGAVTVTATAPDDAAKKALIDEVTKQVAPAKVVDEVSVDDSAPAIDPAKLGALAGQLKANKGVTADFDGKQLVLTGQVADDATSKSVEAAATAAVAPAAVDNQLTVPAGGEPAAAACGNLNARLAAAQKGGKLQFAPSSPQLTNSDATLAAIAKLLKACPDSKVEVGGHTDNQGSKATSQPLSDARAKAVRQALVQRGVPAAQITAKGYGEAKPVASNATEAGRAANRRVEIKVL